MAQDGIIKYEIIIIGGSAGSLEVILKIISAIPAGNSITVIIVVHRKSDNESILSSLLSTRTSLPVKEVEDKDALLPGHIYIAPSDYHLLIENEKTFSLDSSEKIHYSRPSIDATFESVATVYKQFAIAVLLSGANADGAAGLKKIKEAGGFTIVQNPGTAEVGYMPQQAIEQMQPDKILDADEIIEFIKTVLMND